MSTLTTSASKVLIGVNEAGRRVGEDHHRAMLTDNEVGLLLELHEEHNWGYRRLSAKFDISRNAVKKICKGESRCQRATKWKIVHLSTQED